MTTGPPFLERRPALLIPYEWAARLHHGQLREADGAAFILHPLEVAATLSAHAFDDDVVAGGLLHDVVETADTTVEEVRERCGARVAELVAAVTEDPGIADYAERKAALRAQLARASAGAHAVFAADKLAKVREMRVGGARVVDASLERRRLDHYARSLDILRDVAPRLPMVEQLAFELWALHVLPSS